jgi:hypothetical protein
MGMVVNKTTFQVLDSVNTPDYPEESWLVNPDTTGVTGVARKYWKVVDGSLAEMSAGEKAAVDAAASQAYVESVINASMTFGAKVMREFSAQNVLLGITQAEMTGLVRERMAHVISALQTGSLYDAIAQAKAIPSEDKDATFITNARLLTFVNKVETYLGISPLSTSL